MSSGVLITRRYAAESFRKGVASKLKIAMKEHDKGEEWDSARRVGNPCASPLVDSYLTVVSEEQKQAGVPENQAAPMLEHTLTHGPAERHEVAGAGSYFAGAAYLSDERCCPVCTGLFSMRRGYDLSFTLGRKF